MSMRTQVESPWAPAPSVTPAPEVSVTAEPEHTPADLFAAHVEIVREADALDIRRGLWLKPVATIAMTGAGVAAALYESDHSPGPAVTAGAAVTFAALVRLFRGARKDRIRALPAVGEVAQEALNARYELTRMRSKRGAEGVSLRWYGPAKGAETSAPEGQTSVLAQLEHIAQLAANNDVKQMTVGVDLLKLIATRAPNYTPPSFTSMTTQQWLKRYKALHTGEGSTRDEVVVSSPTLWAESVRKYEQSQATESVAGLIRKLKAARDGHPYVQEYDKCKGNANLLAERLGPNIQSSLEDALGKVEAVGVSVDVPRQKQYSQAHIVGRRVVWYTDGRYAGEQDIQAALGLPPERIAAILKYPKQNPGLTELVVKTELHRLFSEQVGATVLDDDEHLRMTSVHPYTLADALVYDKAAPRYGDTVSSLRQRFRQAAAVTLAGLAAAATIAPATHYADKRYELVEQQTADRMRVKNNGQPLDPAAIRAQMDGIAANRVWGDWRDARETMSHWMDWAAIIKVEPANASEDGGGSARHRIGNFSDRPDRDVWRLQATGGMDVTGYWGMTTSNVLHGDAAHDGAPATMYWKGLTPEGPSLADDQLLPEWVADPNTPVIQVQHEITAKDYIERPDGFYIPIPVRKELMPVAATIAGASRTTLIVGLDGTYTLAVPKPGIREGALLTYWVADDKHATSPRATKIVTKEGTMALTVDGNMDFFKKIVEGYLGWQQDPANPGREFTNYDHDLPLIVAYIQKNFSPTTQPFNTEQLKQITSWVSYLQVVFAGKKADCNVAATVMTLADVNLNVATGFLNGKDAARNTLSTHEQHMWDVNQQAEIIDVTQGEGLQHPLTLEDDQQAPMPLWPIEAGLVMAVATAAGVSGRKQLRRGAAGLYDAVVVRQTAASRKLDAADPAIVRFAHTVISERRYAPAVDVPAALARAQAGGDDSVIRAAFRDPLRPDLHSRQTARQLGQLARSNGAQAAELRQARQVIAWGRRAARQPRTGRK